MLISIHALREEGDASGSSSYWWTSTFLSTPSARRATGLPQSLGVVESISIHALREEGDRFQFFHKIRFGVFLSTPSARRATCQLSSVPVALLRFLSTPSARRATSA